MAIMSKITQQILTISKIIVILSMVLMLSNCYSQNPMLTSNENSEPTTEESSEIKVQDYDITFTKSSIPDEIKGKMYGVTISDTSVLKFDDLSYLTLTYYGYDDKTHTGNMIVDKHLADEILGIFKELYEAKFPIEKIRLPCEYDGIDELSMRDNNTSAYNDRPIEGSGGTSYHQLGRAIDINPLVNPYIRFSDGEVLPATAQKYLDRTIDVKGMIKEDSICVQIFKKYGWVWGGDWNSVKDYQHFEKR